MSSLVMSGESMNVGCCTANTAVLAGLVAVSPVLVVPLTVARTLIASALMSVEVSW